MKSMEAKIKEVVVRMAPSPTGNLHIGTARTTLFNFLFAKKHGGKFILRIEDTDKERSTKEYEKNILDGLAWLGLSYDEFFRQSERAHIYTDFVKKMIENGSAYISKEEPKEEGQRSEVVRFRNPNKKVVFEDLVRGTVEFDTTELGDFIVARSPEEPLYHLAVVIDDHVMGVTHVIRGEDHISNTPRQILIQEAIGAIRPVYAHLPLILDIERKKLSKRKHGESVSVDFYRSQGFLPDALLNFLALLGWNPGDEREIFTLSELIDAFDIANVQKGGAVFDVKKLRWINKEHVKRLPKEDLTKIISEKILATYPGMEISEGVISVVSERIEIFSDIDALISSGELEYFYKTPVLDSEKISWKDSSRDEARVHLEHIQTLLIALDEKAPIQTIKDALMPYAEEKGKGNVLWPLRYSLSGKEKSPDPFTLISILGAQESINRIKSAIQKLS